MENATSLEMEVKCRLGLSSYAFYWATKGALAWTGTRPLTAFELLDKVVSLGLEVFQICENVPLIGWDEGELRKLKENAQQLNVVLELGASGLNIGHLHDQMKVAAKLGGRLLRLVPWSGSETKQKIQLVQLANVVNQLMPACIENDITLAVENYFDLPDEDLLAFIREIDNPHVGVCLDTANSTAFLRKPLETVELLAPYVVSLHLKDYTVLKKPGTGYWITGTPLGKGLLDVPRVLDIVLRSGRRPNILLELWMIPAETFVTTVGQEEAWVRESIRYARQQIGIGQDD